MDLVVLELFADTKEATELALDLERLDSVVQDVQCLESRTGCCKSLLRL